MSKRSSQFYGESEFQDWKGLFTQLHPALRLRHELGLMVTLTLRNTQSGGDNRKHVGKISNVDQNTKEQIIQPGFLVVCPSVLGTPDRTMCRNLRWTTREASRTLGQEPGGG